MDLSPNFSFLEEYDPLLVRCAAQAERYIFDDPNVSLIKLRQFGELLAQEIAARTGVFTSPDDNSLSVLRKIEAENILPLKVIPLFHSIRKTGNRAVHELQGNRQDALYHLRMAWTLAVWFHNSFGKSPKVVPTSFVPPPDPKEAEAELVAELHNLREALSQAQEISKQESERRLEAEEKSQRMYDDLNAALALAEETDEQRTAEKRRYSEHLASLQQTAAAQPSDNMQLLLAGMQKAGEAIYLNEADTRKLIDEQLREAGWLADTQKLSYKKNVRPQKGKNMAIAEWPTATGPADYVLFVGLTAIGVVEAKRKTKDVAGSVEQSKRYSRGFAEGGGWVLAGGPWGEYKVPFLFATNGRPFLRQLATKSGIWFLDGRLTTNHPRPLEGWHSPDGLKAMLGIDVPAAEDKLRKEPTNYLDLRDYQVEAILAVERAIAEGKQTALLAMATGTGKTRTCIGLAYRLLKAKRFRRILFLVDRTSLGEQAAGAFKEVKLENLQAFSDIYDVKELGDIVPDSDTRLHISTIQGIIRRLLYPSDESKTLSVDLYDCVIIDECHRGYSLDREMSESELVFRSESDYISKYTRALDHFDAVKIGLTATPALHTTEIFGPPVFTYSYRQAVIDGHLIDHEPPIRILTELVKKGMKWKKGAVMELYFPKTGRVNTINVPDEVNIEVDKFNTVVITEKFNRVICDELAKHIDPTLPGKTLIFCATDSHADMVVDLLKKAFEKQYGEVDDNAIQKITAAADKPLDKIRRYKNEKLPSVAVTVDLLSTGIDVPEIINIVFIRRVRSRILYEQMLGRATRKCDEIGKELFRIYDTVDLYKALEDYTDMKPVVSNPKIPFAQLVQELGEVVEEEHRKEVQEQIAAKFHRKKRLIKGEILENFLAQTDGIHPPDLAKKMLKWSPQEVSDWFAARPFLPKWLDNLKSDEENPLIISGHEDEVVEVAHGYGEHAKPQDYLDSFANFIKANMNRIPALVVVTTKPRDLTRKQLRELKIELDREGYSETNLRTAWKDATNQEIAASIIGYIRRIALGSPLVPYGQRVDRAMKAILASRNWTEPQRKWLDRIGRQLLAETIVDREALDSGQFRAQGGFGRLNRIFDGKLENVLEEINDELWRDTAQG